MASPLTFSHQQTGCPPQGGIKRKEWLRKALSNAADTDAARNGLLLPEHIVYSMAWKEMVNRSSKDITVVYNAIGPDISTVMFATNPRLVFGIDVKKFDPTLIDLYISKWDLVDHPYIDLPPVSRRLMPPELRYKASVADLEDLFIKSLSERRRKGFWEFSDIDIWSIERMMVIELKCIGVDPKTISISEEKGNLRLDFVWAYPGHGSSERTVYFLNGYAYEVFERSSQIMKFDGFYQKAAHVYSDNVIMPMVPSHLNEGGFVLVGRPVLMHSDISPIGLLGGDFTRIAIPDDILFMMRQIMQIDPGCHSEYGWKLEGARKSNPEE